MKNRSITIINLFLYIILSVLSCFVIYFICATVYVGDIEGPASTQMTVVGVDSDANLAAVSDGQRIYSYNTTQNQVKIGDTLQLVGISAGYAYVPEHWEHWSNIMDAAISIFLGVVIVFCGVTLVLLYILINRNNLKKSATEEVH